MGRGRPHKCPYCDATKSVAKGFRYNQAGKVRLRRCKECGRRWTCGAVSDEGNSAALQETGQYPEDAELSGNTGSDETPRALAYTEQENGGAEQARGGDDSRSSHDDSGEEVQARDAGDRYL